RDYQHSSLLVPQPQVCGGCPTGKRDRIGEAIPFDDCLQPWPERAVTNNRDRDFKAAPPEQSCRLDEGLEALLLHQAHHGKYQATFWTPGWFLWHCHTRIDHAHSFGRPSELGETLG